MNYRRLGKTGLMVSEIGLGGEWLERHNFDECKKIIDACHDAGINILDCWMSEPNVRSNIGAAIRGHREEWYIQGHLCSTHKTGQHTRTRDLTEVKEAFADLLTRLGTDYIDLGMLYFVDSREDWRQNKPTFVGYYAQIIQRYAEMQKGAHFFLVTIPTTPQNAPAREARADEHAAALYDMAHFFGEDKVHVIDLRRYAPAYDEEFYRNFFLGGHMNPAGYLLTAKMMASYIDYIIRRSPEKFARAGFIGTERA